MNKSELVEQVAGRAGLSHGQAAGAIEATLAAIEAELATGGEVAITGFGRFSVAARSARQARNPRTGEPIGSRRAARRASQPAANSSAPSRPHSLARRASCGRASLASKSSGKRSTDWPAR